MFMQVIYVVSYKLRAYDAMQLACALKARNELVALGRTTPVFVSADSGAAQALLKLKGWMLRIRMHIIDRDEESVKEWKKSNEKTC